MGGRVEFKPGARFVVTGGAGFVGSTLVTVLLGKGCSVAAIDNLSNGDLRDLPIDNSRLSFQKLTVGDPAAAVQVYDAVASADAVFHLASPIGVMLAHHQRYSVTRNILNGGSMIVDACQRHARPLMFLSSSEVYGPGQERPIVETDPLVSDIRPRWGYAAAKAAVEHMVAGLFLELGVPSWIVRPFNMAGAGQKPATGLVIATFAQAALQSTPLTVHGDGSQARAFLHVSDAVEALLQIMSCPQLCGRPVNLGGTEPMRIDDLARLVVTTANADVPIIKELPEAIFGREFAVSHMRIPDISLLTEMTGWRPTRSTERAIADCIEYLRNR